MSRRRWVCPEGCGNNVLAPERIRKDNVLRYCLPCSERTGKLVERICPAVEARRERAKAKRQEKSAAERAAERESFLLSDGTDVRKLVKRAKRLRAWSFEGDHVAAAVRRCRYEIDLSYAREYRGLAWPDKIQVWFGKETHVSVAMTVIVHELAHVANNAIAYKRGERKVPHHDRRFWSLWEAAMHEVYPQLSERREEMYRRRDALVAENNRLAKEHGESAYRAYNHYAMELANMDLIREAHDSN